MTHAKHAQPDHPIQETIAKRWSPYVYDDRAVGDQDLRSLFEAARWAPSAFNEQPWRFIVARKTDSAAHARLLSCLVEANQAWAGAVPVLALGLVKLELTHNGRPNRSAHHDLGLAAATLVLEATARGLSVHQMGGILPDRAREIYGIPEGFEAVTGFAIGYAGQAEGDLGARDQTPRARRPQDEFVFTEKFGQALE